MKQFDVAISLQGFDNRSIESFELFFDSQCGGQFKITELESSAEILIIDFDVVGPSGLRFLRQNHPKLPIVLLSLRDYENDDPLTFSLKKPLVYSELRKLLKQTILVIPENISPIVELRDALLEHIQLTKPQQADDKTQKRMAISSTDVADMDKTQLACLVGRQTSVNININNPHAVMKVVFEPSKHFLGAVLRGLKRAKYEKKMIELFNLNNRIIIDPEKRKIYTFVGESVLRPLCLMNLKETSTVKVVKGGRDGQVFQSKLKDTSEEINEWSWDEFLWKMTLWTSRGKIPAEVDIQKPVHLTQWPNLTRLQLIPHAISIATMMKGSHLRLTDIAKKLDIEPRYVFAFFSACYILGIADSSKRQSDTLFQPETVPADEASQSVLSKMFGFLGKQEDQPQQTSNQMGVNS